MNPFRVSFFVGTLLSLLFLTVATIDGQTSRGTLTGTITDSGGAIIGRAAVTVTQAGTNAVRQTTTNEAGIYRFDALDLGTYTMLVQANGFTRAETTGVEISAARTTNIDVSLKVGAVSETVTVESATEVELQTS